MKTTISGTFTDPIFYVDNLFLSFIFPLGLGFLPVLTSVGNVYLISLLPGYYTLISSFSFQ